MTPRRAVPVLLRVRLAHYSKAGHGRRGDRSDSTSCRAARRQRTCSGRARSTVASGVTHGLDHRSRCGHGHLPGLHRTPTPTRAAAAAGPADMDVVFDSGAMTADVQAAANAALTTYTVGLCACSSSGTGESNQDRWKRWYNQFTTLTVTYNSYPTVGPRSTTPSTPCVTGSGLPYVGTATPQLNAQINDPDGGSVSPSRLGVAGGAQIGSALTGTATAGRPVDHRARWCPVRRQSYHGASAPRMPACSATVHLLRAPFDTTAPSVTPGVSRPRIRRTRGPVRPVRRAASPSPRRASRTWRHT